MAKNTTKKIEKLTAEQEAQFDVYRDKWLAIGLSTERVDFERAKAAVKHAYACAGLPEPNAYHFTQSPRDAFELVKREYPQVSRDDFMSSLCYGSHEASWLSFYNYLKEVVGLECCDPLDGMTELAQESGWVCMFDEVAIIQDRPIKIKFDDQKRLHCEDGPAVEYSDGFGVYSWHGVAIPAEWMTNKDALTPKIALTWENLEQRRAACEILGWNNILKTLKAKVIDKDEDPMVGTLLEVNIPDIGKEKFLRVLCGTGREFAIPVPPDMKTALAANAWTFDIPEDTLKMLEVRT